MILQKLQEPVFVTLSLLNINQKVFLTLFYLSFRFTVFDFFFLVCLLLAFQTQCVALEASQQLVKVERLCGGWAGPDSLGTGSVSGFGGRWLVAKAIP